MWKRPKYRVDTTEKKEHKQKLTFIIKYCQINCLLKKFLSAVVQNVHGTAVTFLRVLIIRTEKKSPEGIRTGKHSYLQTSQ